MHRLNRKRLSVGQFNGDVAAFANHVLVGDDQSVLGNDKAGSDSFGITRSTGNGDNHHRRTNAFIQLSDGGGKLGFARDNLRGQSPQKGSRQEKWRCLRWEIASNDPPLAAGRFVPSYSHAPRSDNQHWKNLCELSHGFMILTSIRSCHIDRGFSYDLSGRVSGRECPFRSTTGMASSYE